MKNLIRENYRIILMFLAIMLGGSLVWYLYGDYFSAMTPQSLKTYIESKGMFGVAIFVIIEITQIVIAVLPGEPIQLAGGYIYGVLGGFTLIYIGLIIGSTIAFFIARFFGIKVVSKLVPEKHLEKANQKLKSKQGIIAILVLSAIPGIPKDVLVYAAGLGNIAPKNFLPIYFLARIPAVLITSYLGAQVTHVL